MNWQRSTVKYGQGHWFFNIVFQNISKVPLMKRLILPLIAFVFCFTAICQEPESFNYQAIVRNVAGEIVATQSVSIKFSILKGSISGDVVYSEKHSVTTSRSGLISLTIGNGTEKTGDIKSIAWNSDSYFLKVELDPSGGTKFADMGTTQLLIVPDILPAKRTKKNSPVIEEDELFIIRKYVGRFIDYRHTGPETYGGPNLIWIKTSMEKTYGKISAYGKSCEFNAGDNLYIKRILFTPGGVSGYWIYQIENDSSVYYRVSDLQHDKKVLTETWFQ